MFFLRATFTSTISLTECMSFAHTRCKCPMCYGNVSGKNKILNLCARVGVKKAWDKVRIKEERKHALNEI